MKLGKKKIPTVFSPSGLQETIFYLRVALGQCLDIQSARPGRVGPYTPHIARRPSQSPPHLYVYTLGQLYCFSPVIRQHACHTVLVYDKQAKCKYRLPFSLAAKIASFN